MSILDHLLLKQPRLFEYLNSLEGNKKDEFAQYLLKFDFDFLAEAFKTSQCSKLPLIEDISPIGSDKYVDRNQLTTVELDRLFNIGLKAISEGKVAVLVLAGGQASRLGADCPKGVLSLGTGLQNRTDSLLFIQAAQISFFQEMAHKHFPNSNKTIITWLVMTSRSTDAQTRTHLKEVIEVTGLHSDQVIVFSQDELPAFDFNGEIFLSSPTQFVTSPDGNGGMYQVIAPILPKLEQLGIEYFHVYCVDNILCRVPDLHMIGCSIDKKADCALKVIEKKNPTEKVGHVCTENGKLRVLEYSEIPKELAEKRDPNSPDKLLFRAGNIANHFFTFNFLQNACMDINSLPYHSARKRIPYMDPVTCKNIQPVGENGIKLERFIFDAFIHAKNFMVWQVPIEEEFSPLKNPNSTGVDCLSTCIRDFNSVHGDAIREICKGFCKKELN